MSVAASVVVPADPGEVWQVWSELEAWPEWNPVFVSAELGGDLAAGTAANFKMLHPRGRPYWTRPIITVVTPDEELTWTAKGMGLRARTQSRLEPHPQGTKLRMQMDSTGVMGFAYRIAMTKKVQAQLILDTLDAFAAKMTP